MPCYDYSTFTQPTNIREYQTHTPPDFSNQTKSYQDRGRSSQLPKIRTPINFYQG